MYPFGLQDFAHGFGNIFVFASNQTRPHFYNRDFAAEAAIHLGKFQPNITSADNDQMLRQEVDIHHGGVCEKRDILNPRHLGNKGSSTDVDINLVGLQNFIVDHHSVRRLKAGVALNDRAVLQSSQPLLYALVRPPGHCILARFDAFHINAHITVDAETVFGASAGNMGRVGAGDHRLCRDASRVHTGAAELVAFDDRDCFARVRKPRRQGRACLARPDDDGVEVLHAASAPSICSLPSRAASSGVLPFWRATI